MCIQAVHMGLFHAQVTYVKSVVQSLERMPEGWELRLEGQVSEVYQQKTV